ncbi:D-fructose-6-phosphate amidotransferase [Vibrio sp. CAU 1672]|uniref:D-fructose-6-phosphate amidotransferase n=1 Tax=Vibrio sp. CAU 1672 TaxID=3032594 RepID=UPI0023DBAA2A|nr:D-fructose-6-phosphate amidotransferase [Vibrio sp. CAU 1672]MDF2152869.1 D-fructose-6-phosphate amidotransferase [Vibrio sp. CAU 1672]
MTASKVYFRDFLGLVLIFSTVLAGLGVLLDMLAVFTYLNHEEAIAISFLHESFYLLVFFVPPYFIAKYINRAELVKAVEEFLLMKSKTEQF